MTATTRPAPATELALPATFANPVIAGDFPDPFILRVGDFYYAYATNTGGVELPVRRSADLLSWEDLGEGLARLPGWARRGLTWAPDVMPVAGGYVLYYTARHAASGRQVLGVAFSAHPQGPFEPVGDAPLVAQHELGGAIDAHAFVDADGQRYLYWKNDGNSRRLRTVLWVQRLSEDGLALLGAPRALLHNDAAWEGPLIEAPFLFPHEGRYYLFFSGAEYGNRTYGIGYAVGDSPLGPFEKAPDNPFMRTRGEVAGPGGQGLLRDAAGDTWLYYHAWSSRKVGYRRGGVRSLRFDRIDWVDGRPVLRESGVSRQLAPAVLARREAVPAR